MFIQKCFCDESKDWFDSKKFVRLFSKERFLSNLSSKQRKTHYRLLFITKFFVDLDFVDRSFPNDPSTPDFAKLRYSIKISTWNRELFPRMRSHRRLKNHGLVEGKKIRGGCPMLLSFFFFISTHLRLFLFVSLFSLFTPTWIEAVFFFISFQREIILARKARKMEGFFSSPNVIFLNWI